MNGMDQPTTRPFNSWTKLNSGNICRDGFKGPDERSEVDFRGLMLISHDEDCFSLRGNET